MDWRGRVSHAPIAFTEHVLSVMVHIYINVFIYMDIIGSTFRIYVAISHIFMI